MLHDLMTEINANPFMALGFYGILGLLVGVPMKLMARAVSRIPGAWLNSTSAPAIVAFPTLVAAWFLVRLVPVIDDNALFVALGFSGANAVIGRRVLTPAADMVESVIIPPKKPTDG